MADTLRDSVRVFLGEFCRFHHGVLNEDDPLPMRFLSNYLTAKEVEAECIDWVLQYLTGKCPTLLSSRIARLVADHVAELDLRRFIAEENGKENEKSADDGKPPHAQEAGCIDPDTVLCVSALAPVVFTKVHSLCEAWIQSLPEYLVTDGGKATAIQLISSHAIRNSRRKMEDRHVVLPYIGEMYKLTSGNNQSYMAVFDGHGGLNAAIYASAHFHDNLVKHAEFDTDPAKAIKDTFRLTDEDFCSKANRESLGSGTTGVCALLRDRMLHVGWLGDSEALLVKQGRPVTLVTPHKPERQDEQNRIKALGGFVEYTDVYRVNGFISVARAIGDRNLKPYLCSDADITTVELDGTEEYLVLACDGLWDVVTHQELIRHVYDYLEKEKGDKSGVAQMLVKLAQACDSDDNITVVVVFFSDNITKPAAAEETDSNANQQNENQIHKNDDSRKSEKEFDNSGSGEPRDKGAGSKDDGHSGNAIVPGTNLESVLRVTEGNEAGNCADSKKTFDSKETACSKDQMFGSKDTSDSKGTSASKDMIYISKDTSDSKESKEGWVSLNKASSGLTSNSNSSPKANRENLRLSLHHPSFRDSKDSTDIVLKNRKEKSSSRSSKVKSVHSDTLSNGSGGSDIFLMTQTASKCIGNRRGRKGRNSRRRNNGKDLRRCSRESQHSGVALHTGSSQTRIRSLSESKMSSYARSPGQMPSSRSGGDNVFRLLMGCNAGIINQARVQNKWTVAIAMETDSAAAMFDEEAPKTKSK